MASKQDIAYAAGIIDGEGCITAKKKISASGKPSYQVAVVVAMTDRVVITWLKTHFRGHVSEKAYDNPRYKLQWRWIVTDKAAENFLEIIYFQLKAKQKQADVALLFRNTFLHPANGSHPPSKEVIELREALYQRLKEIKNEPEL